MLRRERCHGPSVLELRAFRAMNTDIELCLRTPRGRAGAAGRALDAAAALVREAERRLSRFDPASEVSRLNQSGAAVLSPLALAAVAAALDAAASTGGLFDPTVYGALLAAGYDRSFERLAEAAPERPAWPGGPAGRCREVWLDRRTRTVRLPAGVGLDLGGIAKGWLADRIARRLGRLGAALADLGGDIAVAGAAPGGAGWEIAIDDPFGGRPPVAVLRLAKGGVATSGVLRRRWRTAAGPQHHLIDPRTGRPADSDLAAVTVLASSAAAAEAAAKAALLLGAAAGAAALEAAPGLAGVMVTSAGEVMVTQRAHPFLAGDGEGSGAWTPATG